MRLIKSRNVELDSRLPWSGVRREKRISSNMRSMRSTSSDWGKSGGRGWVRSIRLNVMLGWYIGYHINPPPPSASTYSLPRRAAYILKRATIKFPGDLAVWLAYVEFASREGMRKVVLKGLNKWAITYKGIRGANDLVHYIIILCHLPYICYYRTTTFTQIRHSQDHQYPRHQNSTSLLHMPTTKMTLKLQDFHSKEQHQHEPISSLDYVWFPNQWTCGENMWN